jgi:pSer/pThr/pTyr-binding forkhead associated (FHA) protein
MTLVNGTQVICAKLYHGDTIRIGVRHTLKVSIITKKISETVSAVYDGIEKLMTTS